MHAVVVNVTISDREAAESHLREVPDVVTLGDVDVREVVANA